MNQHLNITYFSDTDTTSTITLDVNKDKLISELNFFKSLYANTYKESNTNEIRIDLTTNSNCYDDIVIKHFFDFVNCFPQLSEPIQIIKAEPHYESEPKLASYHIKVDFGLGFDMDISEINELLQLCKYFSFDKLQSYLISCMESYPSILRAHSNVFNESYLIYTVSNNKIIEEMLNRDIDIFREKFVTEDFLKNIYILYSFYLEIGKLDIFKRCISIIAQRINPDNPGTLQGQGQAPYPRPFVNYYYDYFKNISNEIELPIISNDEIMSVPLDSLHKLIKLASEIMVVKPVFNLYNFYDILNYDISDFVTFKYTCNENCDDITCVTHRGDNFVPVKNDVIIISDSGSSSEDSDPRRGNGKKPAPKKYKNIKDISDSEDSDPRRGNGKKPAPRKYKNANASSDSEDSAPQKGKKAKPVPKRKTENKQMEKLENDIDTQEIVPIKKLYNMNTHLEFIGKKAIIPMSEYKSEINKLFPDFDWHNVVLSGGYLYGLIDNIHTSILPGSDIDLFVYGKDRWIISQKIKYILEYFSKYNPYCISKGNVITLIIPSLSYDIQIISHDYPNPMLILEKVDYNYVKMFYDGYDIYCSLDCLLAIKYKIAMYCYDQKVPFKGIRLYKTILKGLRLEYDPAILNSEFIDLCGLHNNLHIKFALNKSVSVRKLSLSSNPIESEYLIKAFYKTDTIKLMSLNDTDLFGICDEDEYGMMKSKSLIDIDVNDIVDIIEIGKDSINDYYAFVTIDNTIIYNITLECESDSWIKQNKYKYIITICDSESVSKYVNLCNTISNILTKFKKYDTMSNLDNNLSTGTYNRSTVDIYTHLLPDSNSYKELNKIMGSTNTYGNKFDSDSSAEETPKKKVKIVCTGKFYKTTECSGPSGKAKTECGMNFIIDTVEYI